MRAAFQVQTIPKARAFRWTRYYTPTIYHEREDLMPDKSRLIDRRRRFISDALAAREEFDRSGVGYAMGDVHAYIAGQVHGLRVAKPQLKVFAAKR
jgi:hypothetical protein